MFGFRLNKMFFWRLSFVNYKIRRVLCVCVGRLREFWRNPIFWQQNEHNQVLFDAHGFIWLMIISTVDWVTLLVARAASVSFRPKISLFSLCFGAATILFSATCGLRAESARAVTGRRNSHSGRGEDFLTGQPDFFTETAVTPERKVEKSFPRWEINRHVEG